MAFALFVRTFLIGLAVAAPVGAMGVLCIQRTIERGPSAGYATGLGIATGDAAYAALAAFGLSAVAGALVAWQAPLRLVGGLALVYFGARAALSRPAAASTSSPVATGARFGSLYASAVALTLTNPMTIMAFAAVFASAGLVSQPTMGAAALATAGVATGSLAWWVVLISAVRLMSHAVGERALLAINRVSGLAIVGLGLVAVFSAVIR